MKYDISDYLSIALAIIFWFMFMYICGEDREKETVEKSRLLTQKENKVYLDGFNVVHSDKECHTLYSTSDSTDIGRKGVKFIDKRTVNYRLFDTVFVCAECMLNQEYDKLYNGFYRKKIDVSRLKELVVDDE